LNPEVNFEATLPQQYEITLNFAARKQDIAFLPFRSPLPSTTSSRCWRSPDSSEAAVRSGGTGAAQPASALALPHYFPKRFQSGRRPAGKALWHHRFASIRLAEVASTALNKNAVPRHRRTTNRAQFTITYVSNVSSTQQQSSKSNTT